MDTLPRSNAPAADAGGARQRTLRVSLVAVTVALVVVACSLGRQSVAFGPVMVSADGRTLSFSVESCNANPSATIDEEADAVRIQVDADREFGAGGDCLDHAEVQLEQPLDDRDVIDAATGEVVPVDPTGGGA